MANRQQAAQLVAIASDILRTEPGRLPRGAMQRIASALEDGVIGTSRSGRTKYRNGTLAEVLAEISNSLA